MKSPDIKSKKQQELEALAKKSDLDINTSDIPVSDQWGSAEAGKFFRPIKERVSIRLDADILAWFRANHSRYQTAVNKALREYVESHKL